MSENRFVRRNWADYLAPLGPTVVSPPVCRNRLCPSFGKPMREASEISPTGGWYFCCTCRLKAVQKITRNDAGAPVWTEIMSWPEDPVFWVTARREAERQRLVAEAVRKERESGAVAPPESKRPKRSGGFLPESRG